MAAITGFELSIDGSDDVAVAAGLVDGVAVAGGTVASDEGDGTHSVVLDDDGETLVAVAAGTDLTDGQIKLGEFTEDTGAATAVSLAGRGDEAGVSGDEDHVA